ncbi:MULTISPECIES: hypothetical protein [Streptomyces]|uniref:hypothetical protein n=1 Tax=Streptomyces TaxID=1883 RepID=UPI000AFF4B2E|nr:MULTISPECIES: hypothetical protein [Streptomyces]
MMLRLVTVGHAEDSADLAAATLRLADGYFPTSPAAESLAANALDKAAHALFKAERPIEEQIDCAHVRIRLWDATSYGANIPREELQKLQEWQRGGAKPPRIGW